MEMVEFSGWANNARLANDEIELIVTKDIGPRIMRFAFTGERNLFLEMDGQQGGTGEDEWVIRGGHRFWIAPEEKPKTYELDNEPIEITEIPNGIKTIQAVGPITGVRKTMEITLCPESNNARILHVLANEGTAPIELAPWALSAMAKEGEAIIPLPAMIPHTDRLTHNQEWSLWGYTDFSDPRWALGSRYIRFRQDPTRPPNKLGMAHREGWVAYHLGEFLFVKRFAWQDGMAYPDGGMNFETFSNEDFLEVESVGPLVTLQPGESTEHVEEWSLFRGVAACETEDDIDANVRSLVS